MHDAVVLPAAELLHTAWISAFRDFSIPGAAAELLSVQADRFHCAHAVKSPGTLSFLGDLPYFEGFSRMVSALLLGPSMFLAFFKDGRQICSGTFLISRAFQGRSLRFWLDLPGFWHFSRKVVRFAAARRNVFPKMHVSRNNSQKNQSLFPKWRVFGNKPFLSALPPPL